MQTVKQLPYKEIECCDVIKRVLFADPEPFYKIEQVDFYKRINSLNMVKIFPNNGNVCACGCGKELPKRRTRWATDDCAKYAIWVFSVMQGRVDSIKTLLKYYYGDKCISCGCEDYRYGLELEHTIPVYKGGGGCWLSNYTLMCKTCHKQKTKQDLKRDIKNQTNLFNANS